MSTMLLRFITDLRSCRAVIKALRRTHPDLITLTLPYTLITKLWNENGRSPVIVDGIGIFRKGTEDGVFTINDPEAVMIHKKEYEE